MDTGSLGEAILEKWASQVDLIANKSKIDKDGWDFYLGFPKKYDSDLKALDLDDTHSECLVQVKTTTTNNKSSQIKLSNLKRLVDSPIPSFYLILNVSKEGEVEKAFLYHVWESITERVLKKIRKLSKSKEPKLNKFRIQLPTSEAQPFSELNGKELLKLIEINIGKSKSEYIKQKSEIRKNSGYNEERGKIEFTLIVPDNYGKKPEELLIDFSLGLIDNLEVQEHTLFDSRFGEHIKIRSGKGGEISIPKLDNDGKATVEFWTPDYRLNTQLSTKYYVPKGLKKTLLKNKFKIVYKSDYLELAFIPYKNSFDFDIKLPPLHQEKTLHSFRDAADFIAFFSNIQGEYETVYFKIKHSNETITGGEFIIKNKFLGENLINLLKAANFGIRIVDYFKIKKDISTTLHEMTQQFETLKFVNDLISPNATAVNGKFYLNDDLDVYDKAISIFPVLLRFGQQLIAINCSIKGKAKRTGKLKENQVQYKLNSPEAFIESYRFVNYDQFDGKAIFEEMNKQILSSYEKEENTVIIFNQEIDSKKT